MWGRGIPVPSVPSPSLNHLQLEKHQIEQPRGELLRRNPPFPRNVRSYLGTVQKRVFVHSHNTLPIIYCPEALMSL